MKPVMKAIAMMCSQSEDEEEEGDPKDMLAQIL